MSKKFKGLIIGLAALVVLGGAVLLLVLLPGSPGNGDASSSSSEETSSAESYSLTSLDKDSMVNVEIQNDLGTFNIKKTSQDENTDVYTLPELEGYPYSTSLFSTVYSMAASVSSSRIVAEDVSDLSDYGLKDPAARVTVTMKDGSKVTVCLGSEVAAAGGRYGCLEGEKTVYLISTGYTYFFYSKDQFVDLTLTTAYSDTSEEPRIDRLTLSGTNYGDEPIEMEPNEYSVTNSTTHENSAYQLLTPIVADIDSTRGETFLSQFYNLSASGVYAYSPTEEQLAACGLDNPVCVFQMEYTDAEGNKQSTTLRIGSLKDGSYYVMKDGVNLIYTISEDSISSWVNLKWIDVVMRLVHYPTITDVSAVTVKYGTSTYVFNLTSEADEDGNMETTAVTVDGKEYDVDMFKKLYMLFISASAEEYVGKIENPEGERLLSITYSYADGSPDDVIEYISAGSRMVYISQNGVATFKMRQALADKIIESIPQYFAGETITTDW